MGRLWIVMSVLAVVVWSQHHHHSHEPAHMKYTREVNEAAQAEEEFEESHGHSHGDHGHSHDHHGHSHDAHDNGHVHSHSHGHSDDAEGGCPYAKEHAHPSGHGHSHGGHDTPKSSLLKEDIHYTGALSFLNDSRTRLWVYAIGSTILISIAPFIILFFIPIKSEMTLKILLAFGSGGLLGDAFLHLIPHATPAGDGHGHSHSHSHSEGHSHGPHDMSVGGWVLAGIICFLAVEKFVRILRGGEGHGHSHGHSPLEKKEKQSDDEDKKKGDKKKEKGNEDKKKECKDEKTGIKVFEPERPINEVAAYLNLVADFTHNFTDGLAIGASFLAGSTVGFVTMITVLVHEIPHEIGDFAILIQSGYSRRKAMMMQLVTAFGALSGCVLSLLSANGELADAAASSWILPFTAGGFIYIATVSVIPELLETSSFGQSIKEIFAILLGIFLMYLIAVYE